MKEWRGSHRMNDYRRIEGAVEIALFEFWKKIAEHFPEADSGDIDPLANFQFEEEARKIVESWVHYNITLKDWVEEK